MAGNGLLAEPWVAYEGQLDRTSFWQAMTRAPQTEQGALRKPASHHPTQDLGWTGAGWFEREREHMQRGLAG